MGDLTVSGNLIEAVLWAVFGLSFGVMSLTTGGSRRRIFVILTVAFLAFGASDVVEARTGAWWRPVWLLVWKATCIGAFIYAAWNYRSQARRS